MARHGTTSHHPHHGHLEHHGGGHMVRHHIRRKHGGKAGESRGTGKEPMVASGNPDVIKEAEDKEKKYEAKKGGRINKKVGGRTQKADGGKINLGLMHGGVVRPRLDRPGRKSGGRVGSDTAPLSSAHYGSKTSESHPKEQD